MALQLRWLVVHQGRELHDSQFSVNAWAAGSQRLRGIQGGPGLDQPAGEASLEAAVSLQIKIVPDDGTGEKDGDPIDVVIDGRLETNSDSHHFFTGQSQVSYLSDSGGGTVVSIPSLPSGDSIGAHGEGSVRASTSRLQTTIGQNFRIFADMTRDGTIPPKVSFYGESCSIHIHVGLTEHQGTDIATTSLSLDPKQGGVNFGYEIEGGDLPSDTSVELYWARGPRWDDVIDKSKPAYVYNLNTSALKAKGSPPPVHVSRKDLGIPPEGTTYLLVVADPPDASNPSGLIKESDESNNIQALDGSLTVNQLRAIMPALPADKAQLFSSRSRLRCVSLALTPMRKARHSWLRLRLNRTSCDTGSRGSH